LRVIAGSLRSRPLLAPPGTDTRPTADRLRETLFNVLTQGAVDHVAGAAFLDLYAGSGAVGIEAASRGASSVTLVEQGAPALAIMAKNLVALGLRAPQILVDKKPVSRYLSGALAKAVSRSFGVVFLDPPYELEQEYSTTLNFLGGDGAALLDPGAIVVAEHRKKQPLAEKYGALVQFRTLTQGDAALSFYQAKQLVHLA
jgi:16S rRNA (guanine966-N2)-methyltransferase